MEKKQKKVGQTTERTVKGMTNNMQVNNDFLMSIIRCGVALAGGDPNDLSGWTIKEKKG